MQAPPQLVDRLGARHPIGGTRNARNLAVTGIPANETIVLMNWVRISLYASGAMVPSGLWFLSLNGGAQYIDMRFDPTTDRIVWYSTEAGVPQNLDTRPLPSGDVLLATVVDRDNTRLEAWIDGVLSDDAALARDPDLTIGNRMYLNDSAAHNVDYTVWRSAGISLTNGATPSAAEWAEIFRYMRDPHAPLHPVLAAAVGTFYSDYHCGEGLYGSAALTDQGTNGDDLTWQGGETVDDVRVRARTPTRIPRRTFYTLMPGFTATTGNVAFGFAAQPTVVRFAVSHLHAGVAAVQAADFTNAAGTNRIVLEWDNAANLERIWMNAGGWTNLPLPGDQRQGGDLFVVCDGVTNRFYLGAQHIGTLTTAAAVDFSGNSRVVLAGQGGDCCRVTAWNPATVPATFEDEIRECVMNFEDDPPSLSNKRVDFPIRSDLIAAGGNTVANQGLGGGTLTLSAIRSTSCETFARGFDP